MRIKHSLTLLHVEKYVGDASKGNLPNFAVRCSDTQKQRTTVEVREKRSIVLCCQLKQSLGKEYRVAQKKCIHSLLINIFGINLNEISISG